MIKDFKPWLKARQLEVSKKSALGKAIRYTLNHWDGLTRFIDDGRIEIDSNTVERSIKPIGLGKKNYLFAGSEGGAETWAILAPLINTAKLHDVDPRHYLTDVLERIVSGRIKINQLNTLLPWNWKAARDWFGGKARRLISSTARRRELPAHRWRRRKSLRGSRAASPRAHTLARTLKLSELRQQDSIDEAP
ncbi:hypothetical protein GGD61_008277 [Bradyrhizobium sp. SBR1B]|nr:hypothetical protein [Bradyrhizobium sp. SBR1B]